MWQEALIAREEALENRMKIKEDMIVLIVKKNGIDIQPR